MNVYRVLVEKQEEKSPLGRPRRKWEDNIKMDLVEPGWCCMGWIYLVQDRDQWRALLNTGMNLSCSIKYWEILEQLSDWWLLKKDSAPWS
jgi:hypothetical protein